MSFCGHMPGFCGKQADCEDHHCPGRLEAIFEQRQGGALIEDGHPVEDEHEDEQRPSAFRRFLRLFTT